MSTKTMQLTVVTPERVVIKDTALAVGAMGIEGALTALPGHTPFLTSLKPGLLWYRDQNQQEHDLAVSGGFLEILPDKVSVLADAAEKVEEIDLDRAQKALDRAKQRLDEAHKAAVQGKISHDELDMLRAETSMGRAVNRVKLARQRSKKIQ